MTQQLKLFKLEDTQTPNKSWVGTTALLKRQREDSQS